MTPKMVLRAAVARTGLKPAPLSVTYEVTWLCNLSCGYCDRHTPMHHELTREEIFRALEEFRTLGLLHIHLDGGDPLTHRHIDEIVDWAHATRGHRVAEQQRYPRAKETAHHPKVITAED